jgi:hypothetical protein
MSGRQTVAICLAMLSVFTGVVAAVGTWLLRDGLGPDSETSSGFEAINRFGADFWPVALLCPGLLLLAYFVWPKTTSQNRNGFAV